MRMQHTWQGRSITHGTIQHRTCCFTYCSLNALGTSCEEHVFTSWQEDAAKHLTAFNAAVAQCQSASEAATVSMAHQLQEQQRSSRAWLTDIQQRKNGYGPKP